MPANSLNSVEDYLTLVQEWFAVQKSEEDANGRTIGSVSGGGGNGGGGHSTNTSFTPTLEVLPLSWGVLSNEPEVVEVVVRDNEPAVFYRAWLMQDENAHVVDHRIAVFAIRKVMNAHLEYEELDLHEMEFAQLHCIVLDESGDEVRRMVVPGIVTPIGDIQFVYELYPILFAHESLLSVLEMHLRPGVNTLVRMHRTLAPSVDLMDTSSTFAMEFNMGFKVGWRWKESVVLPADALDCSLVGAPMVNQFFLINDDGFTVLLDATHWEFELPAGANDLLIAEFRIRGNGQGGIWKLAEHCGNATGTALDALTLVVSGTEVLPGIRLDRGTSGALWLCDAHDLTFSATEEVPVEIWVNTDPELQSGDTLLHVQDVEVGNYSEEFNILFANRFIAGNYIRFSGLWDFSQNPSGLVGFSFSH